MNHDAVNHPIHLGVNIDHIATLRQARGTLYPDPLQGALLAERAGADSITLHLREDRRHIQERDVRLLRGALQTRMNLEMACTEAMLAFALDIKPADVCLVPEKRAELTTEGGLDVLANFQLIHDATQRLSAAGIRVSLFIDPDERQVAAARRLGAPVVELHTGAYAHAQDNDQRERQQHELQRLQRAAQHAAALGLVVNAGHGLHYHNVQPIAAIGEIIELNIGHAIIAQALFVGLSTAVRDMKQLMLQARA